MLDLIAWPSTWVDDWRRTVCKAQHILTISGCTHRDDYIPSTAAETRSSGLKGQARYLQHARSRTSPGDVMDGLHGLCLFSTQLGALCGKAFDQAPVLGKPPASRAWQRPCRGDVMRAFGKICWRRRPAWDLGW